MSDTECSYDKHKREDDFEESNLGLAKKQRTAENAMGEQATRRDSDVDKVSEEETNKNVCLKEAK